MTHKRISQEESYLCRCSTTFPVYPKAMKKNASQMQNSFLFMQGDLEQGNGHFSVLVLRKSGPLSMEGECDNMVEKMMLEFSESGHPIFHATSPLSRGRLKSKGHGNLSIHYAAVQETIEIILRTIVSANQLSLYGAIAEICEEYEILYERTVRTVMMGQSSSSLVTEVPLDCDDLARKDLPLKQYGE